MQIRIGLENGFEGRSIVESHILTEREGELGIIGVWFPRGCKAGM